MSDRFTVVTGGPGAGKSTLIDALAALGFATRPEVGRAIVRDQRRIGGGGVPWRDPQLFAELMLSAELASHRDAARNHGRVFFDRGVVDVVASFATLGPVPAHAERAAVRVRYATTVFIAPPWPGIYHRDRERRQSPAEAEATFHAMADTYPRFGYRLIELPRADVRERVRFVLAHVGAEASTQVSGTGGRPR